MFGVARLNTLARYAAPAGSAVTEYNFVSATTSTTSTIAWPADRAAGDLAILVQGAGALNTPPTAVTPTGFTNIANTGASASAANRTMVDYKILTGSESGNITGMNGSTNRKNLFIYRPNSAITTLTISTVNQQTTTGTPTNQTLSMSGLTGPYIGIAAYMSSGTITARGSTVTASREVTANSTTNYTKTFESNKADQTFGNSTISMADYGTNALVSFTILIR
jgi:hypothetical protein